MWFPYQFKCEWCGQYIHRDANGRCSCCGAPTPPEQFHEMPTNPINLEARYYTSSIDVLLNSAQANAYMLPLRPNYF